MNKKFLEDGVTPNPAYNPKFLEDGVTPNPEHKEETEEERVERLATERARVLAAEQLKDTKLKLDNAYAARDQALAEAAALKLAETEAKRKKLEEEGNYKALYELQIQEEKDKRAQAEAAATALAEQNTVLTRDNSLQAALKGLNFRNDKAADMAFREIVGELVKSDGVWIHKTGVSIKDYVKAYSQDDSQAFLFKAKQNNGGGSKEVDGNVDPNKGKSLFARSQADVIKDIEAGKIKTR